MSEPALGYPVAVQPPLEPLLRPDAAVIGSTRPGRTTLTTSQTFASVHDLNTQFVNARVWIGFHFRNSVTAGDDQADLDQTG